MARTTIQRRLRQRASNQLDADIVVYNQPLTEQLPNYTCYIHTAGTRSSIYIVQDQLLHNRRNRNRSGRTFIEEIEHRRRLAYIRAGHPATLDLWYPPRYLTPPEYQRELEHTEFLELYRPNPVQQTVDLDFVQQPAEPHEQIVVRINYPQQFKQTVRRLLIIFIIFIILYVY